MTRSPHQLRTLRLGDDPAAWRAAGFAVTDDGLLRLGATTLVCSGSGERFEGWALDGVTAPVDGLAAVDPVETAAPAGGHPNGITAIDHVVIDTDDQDRTVAAFEAAGLEVRGGRSTSSYGRPMRQTFFWAGDVIIELVGPETGEPTGTGPAGVFGVALVADDLDATARHLGELLGEPKDAVQPGRRIAGLRTKEVGIRLPVAVMSPHVRPG